MAANDYEKLPRRIGDTSSTVCHIPGVLALMFGVVYNGARWKPVSFSGLVDLQTTSIDSAKGGLWRTQIAPREFCPWCSDPSVLLRVPRRQTRTRLHRLRRPRKPRAAAPQTRERTLAPSR